MKKVNSINLRKVTFYEVRNVQLKNKDIINYDYGLSFILTLIKSMPNFILNAYYGSGIVGVYDMSLKVLNIPKNIISANMGELYYQKGSAFYNRKPLRLKKITFNTGKVLVLFGVISYLPIIMFGEELFIFFLGDKWKISGEISEIISFWYLLLFLTSPLSYVFYIKRVLSKLFWFIFASFVIKIVALIYCVTFNNAIDTIYIYTYICIYLELFLIWLIIRNGIIKV